MVLIRLPANKTPSPGIKVNDRSDNTSAKDLINPLITSSAIWSFSKNFLKISSENKSIPTFFL